MRRVGAAIAELAGLRSALAATLESLGLRAAVCGTHPFAQWHEIEVSGSARYRTIYDSMRELARREPTFALHVHVAVPDAESALRALCGLRVHVPLLLALAANSPFWQGRDTGLAAARVPVFGTFPRVGIPRGFASYAEYVEAVDMLLRCDAFPEPTFLWWDVRLQPRFGTVEVRIMDAQTRIADNAALAALVQCAVRLEATEGYADAALAARPEVLDENRFIAARDGMRAELLDPARDDRRPAADILAELLVGVRPARCSARLRGRARRRRRSRGFTRRAPPAHARGGEPGRSRRSGAGHARLLARGRVHRRRRLPRRPPRLDLVRVPCIALEQVGQPHPQAVVLVLPHVTELVRDELVGDLAERVLEQDQVGHVVAAEAPEPRQPEQPRHVQDAHAVEAQRPAIERLPLEPSARARERLTLGPALSAPAQHGRARYPSAATIPMASAPSS